ncbi:MAG: hypothetical protein DYH05_07460 [Acidobacteria bacterium ACB1]|nr:hypothetical protein [Pyrinomonadaceae bacterium]MCE7962322.1 hypothetical protein [Acidobacteria bacterium ACB1]RIJ93234.1 MAG: hypothetical protein DCC44_06830 [Acidobacteriota bacterium]
MRKTAFQAMLSVFALIILSGAAASAYASTISGTVYDQKRNGLPYVAVELQNDRYVMIQHATTDGIGRYSFDGLGDGTYYVKVMPFKYDMDEQTQEVKIETIAVVGAGNVFIMQDFYLTPRKGTLAAAQAEVIIAQQIPDAAKDKYDAASKLIKKGKTDEAIPLLEAALKSFPEYFLANDALGQIYFHKNDFEHAAPLLLKASQVYDKSPMTLYYLGVSFAYLRYYPTAIMALNAAAVLAPESSAVHLALGKTYISSGDLTSAEASLLKAKKFSKEPTAELYKQLARVYKDTKQYSKAAANLESMLKNGNYSDEAKAALKKEIQEYKAKAIANNEKPSES